MVGGVVDAALAYAFALPLVLTNVTLSATAGSGCNEPARNMLNRLEHIREFPSAGADGAVVRSNVDTLYSIAWVDVSAGPVVLRAPSYGSSGRYFLWQLMDAWTSTFASPSERVNGTLPQGGAWALCAPGWAGHLPAGIARIDAPTRHTWLIGRTAVQGEDDLPAARALQDATQLYALSAGPPGIAPLRCNSTGVAPGTPDPKDAVNAMSAKDFFVTAAAIMAGGDRPNPPDPNATAALARVGITVGRPLDWKRDVALASKLALQAAKSAGPGVIAAGYEIVGKHVNGWSIEPDDIGNFGTDYVTRAGCAEEGLGANKREDAIYYSCDHDGAKAKLSGAHSYTLTFDAKAGTPPVHAFWSITLYNENGFLVRNSASKYAVSSWQNLTFGDDGALELSLQPKAPADATMLPNWLPTPADGSAFNVIARMYWPKPAMLDATFVYPALVKRD